MAMRKGVWSYLAEALGIVEIGPFPWKKFDDEGPTVAKPIPPSKGLTSADFAPPGG